MALARKTHHVDASGDGVDDRQYNPSERSLSIGDTMWDCRRRPGGAAARVPRLATTPEKRPEVPDGGPCSRFGKFVLHDEPEKRSVPDRAEEPALL